MLRVRRTTPELQGDAFTFFPSGESLLVVQKGKGVACFFNLSRLPHVFDMGHPTVPLVSGNTRTSGAHLQPRPPGFVVIPKAWRLGLAG